MKKLIKLMSGLLFLAIICTSCELKGGADNPFYVYNLYVSVQDASGNDLLEGIDWYEYNQSGYVVNDDLYTLEAVFPDLRMDPAWTIQYSNAVKPDPYEYRLGILTGDVYGWGIDNYNYLSFDPSFSNMHFDDKDLPPADKIIYRLSFPCLFGDEEVHEIVTYWKKDDHNRRMLCHRIELDGKEFTGITYENSSNLSFAAIVLDR